MGIRQYTGRSTLVVFTWKEFIIFTDNENYKRKQLVENVSGDIIPFLRNEGESEEFKFGNFVQIYNRPPTRTSYSYDVDGNGQLSFTFPLKEEHLRFRPLDKEEHRLTGSTEMDRFFKYLWENQPYLNYLRQSEGKLFDDEYIRQMPGINVIAGECYHELAPEYIFQPMQPVWLFTLASDSHWYKSFTGYIQQVSETDDPGRERTLTVKAVNPLGILQKIPIIYKQMGNLLLGHLLESSEERKLLEVWLGTYFAPEGDSMNVIASYKMEELLSLLMKMVNKSYGLLHTGGVKEGETREDLATKLAEELKHTQKFTAFGIDKEETTAYLKAIEEFREHRFRFFKEEIGKYTGNSLLMEDKIKIKGIETETGIVKINDLVDEEGNISHIQIGSNFIDTIDLDKLNSFNKLFYSTVKLWNMDYSSVAEIIRKFTSTFVVDSWTDGSGNIVIDYPRFDNIPNYEKGISNGYKDHDNKYIIEKRNSSFSFVEDAGKIVTLMTAPASYHHGIDVQITARQILTGYDWGSFKEMLNFGILRKDLAKLFATKGLTAESFDSMRGLLDSIAKAFRSRYNADVFSGSFESKGRFDLQLGRNVLVPHKERTYFITRIHTSLTSGRDFVTTFDLSYGKPLWKVLGNPWQQNFFIETIKDIERKTEINYACKICEGIIEGRLTIWSKWAACMYNLLTHLCKMSVTDIENWINTYVPLSDYEQPFSETFELIRKTSAKESGCIEIDARLFYILTYVQKFLEDNKDIIFATEEFPKADNVEWHPALDVELIDSEYFHDERRKEGKIAYIRGIRLLIVTYKSTGQQVVSKEVQNVCSTNLRNLDLHYRTQKEAAADQYSFLQDVTTSHGAILGLIPFTYIFGEFQEGNRYADIILTAIKEAMESLRHLPNDCEYLEYKELKNKDIRLPHLDLKELRTTSAKIFTMISWEDLEREYGWNVNEGKDVTCEELPEERKRTVTEYTRLEDIAGKNLGKESGIFLTPHINYSIYNCSVQHYVQTEKKNLELVDNPVYRDGILLAMGTYKKYVAEQTIEALSDITIEQCQDCFGGTFPIGKDKKKSGFRGRVWEFRRDITEASKKWGVSEGLIYAVIGVESGGRWDICDFTGNSSGVCRKTSDIDHSVGLMHVTKGLYETMGLNTFEKHRTGCIKHNKKIVRETIDVGARALNFWTNLAKVPLNDYFNIWLHYNAGKQKTYKTKTSQTAARVEWCAIRWNSVLPGLKKHKDWKEK